MAIIATIKTANGTVVRIHDDDMAQRGTPEYEAIREQQCRAAHMILVKAGERREG